MMSFDTVGQVKCMICEIKRIPAGHLLIKRGGMPLDDSRTLGSYGITRESILQLQLLVLGAGHDEKMEMEIGDAEPEPMKTASLNAHDDINSRIDTIKAVCGEAFPPGKIFPSKEVLVKELELFGKKYGFGVSLSGKQICCTRGGQTRVHKTDETEGEGNSRRKRTRVNSLKCDCTFVCNFGYVIGTFRDPENPLSTTTKDKL